LYFSIYTRINSLICAFCERVRRVSRPGREQTKEAAAGARLRRAESEEQARQGQQQARDRLAPPVRQASDDKAQTSFTDPELRATPQNNKGWDYSGNA
jgi:hypothetical protein